MRAFSATRASAKCKPRWANYAPPKKFRVYEIDVPWDGPITQEQQDQLIDESGIKEREDYEEEAFNIFRFYVGR